MTPGRATPEGTRRFAQRFPAPHFREFDGLHVSSLGIGTYLGEPDDETDVLVAAAVRDSVAGGINVVDTAINYRYERGERSVGAAIESLPRQEIVLCTKGGFVPTPDDPEDYVRRAGAADLVAGCHCMHPAYLLHELERSRKNLGVETIDLYYVHNPETQLPEVGPDAFYERLGRAFEALEGAVRDGRIGAYGMATWNAFREPPEAEDAVSLERAKSVAGPNFKYVQLPLNLAMPEALFAPTQIVRGEAVPALEAARRLGLAAISSGSICQGRVVGRLPDWMRRHLGLDSDAQRALQFSRSAPGLLTALVGMKDPAHVRENLALVGLSPLGDDGFRRLVAAGV
jgi:aryl-alcohol dehydrogenase-like predicted oxidoreductase